MEQKSIKNKNSIIIGFLTGIVTITFLPEIFQSLIHLIISDFPQSLNFNGLFVLKYNIEADKSLISSIIISGSPFIILIIVSEISFFVLKKTSLGFNRYSLIIYLIILNGFLIIKTFYGCFVIVLQSDLLNDVFVLSSTLFENIEGQIVFVFLLVIILTVYLNLVIKRISNYIII